MTDETFVAIADGARAAARRRCSQRSTLPPIQSGQIGGPAEPQGGLTMAAAKRKPPTGIRERHSRACPSRTGDPCRCEPSYEAWVYLPREDRKVRKTFARLAEAKAWRQDAVVAVRKGTMRAPSATTLQQASAELLAGMRAARPRPSGGEYKPATIRGYERS